MFFIFSEINFWFFLMYIFLFFFIEIMFFVLVNKSAAARFKFFSCSDDIKKIPFSFFILFLITLYKSFIYHFFFKKNLLGF